MPRTTTALPLALAAVLALGACAPAPPPTSPGGGADPPTSRPWDEPAARAAVTALPAGLLADFDGCEELLTYYQANALELVTPYGIGSGGWGYAVDDAEMTMDGDLAGEDTGSSGADESAAPEHSTTNVQEEGVDEPDIVKTDGRIIATAVNGRVRVVDVGTAQVLSTVRMPGRADQVHATELLLHDDTLVVLGEEWAHARPVDGRHMAFPSSRTVVTTVDLSDPADPRTVGSVRLEGSYRSARLVGDTVRMVMVTEPPGVEQVHPSTGTLRAEQEAEDTNRDLIRATTIDDWVPHLQALDAQGQVQSTDVLLDCDQISRPRDPVGLSTLSVLTFDVGSATPTPTSGTGLVASGGAVYASTDRLVVATSPWNLWAWAGGPAVDMLWPGGQPANRTDLHAFDISDPGATTYTASGSVEGHLLSQWALDEQDGVIRVATTVDPPGASQSSESSLAVLREEGEELVETGRVDGLGVTETIRAVRYLSADLAAVVTFRQTDPLYLIDTSDPTAPTVAGELKIPGYSAYLHPIGRDRLLGIGQDADERTGQTKGLQVSMFDISDLSAPRQTQVITWPDSYTPVEHEHRAFLHWPATGQVFLPVTRWAAWEDGQDEPGPEDHFAGVTVLDVDERGMAEGPSVSTSPDERSWGEGPLRTLVVGDDLWTLDRQGMARFDLATMEGGWVLDLP